MLKGCWSENLLEGAISHGRRWPLSKCVREADLGRPFFITIFLHNLFCTTFLYISEVTQHFNTQPFLHNRFDITVYTTFSKHFRTSFLNFPVRHRGRKALRADGEPRTVAIFGSLGIHEWMKRYEPLMTALVGFEVVSLQALLDCQGHIQEQRDEHGPTTWSLLPSGWPLQASTD